MTRIQKKDIKTEVQRKRKTPYDKKAEKHPFGEGHRNRTEGPEKCHKAEINADNKAKEESAYSVFDITNRLLSFTQTSSSKKRMAGQPLKYAGSPDSGVRLPSIASPSVTAAPGQMRPMSDM